MYSVYCTITGMFTGLKLKGDEDYIRANLGPDEDVLLGEYDPLRQIVHLATLEVLPWVPPKPADNEKCMWSWSEENKEWLPEPTDIMVAEVVREQRAALLAETDWVTAKAAETGGPIPDEWKAYRQALRDVTSQPGFPRNVVWPTKPT